MSNSTRSRSLALYSSLLGGFTTFIGANDRFGTAGALILVAVLFLVVGFLFLGEDTAWLSKFWRFAERFGQEPIHFFVVASICFLVASVSYVAGFASLRIARGHLPLLKPNLKVEEVAFLQHKFSSDASFREAGKYAEEDENASASLFRWASKRQGEGQQLYYIESEEIPENCDDVLVSCLLEDMHARDCVAYLVKAADGSRLWQRPVLRSLPVIINNDGSRITASLTKPNGQEKLVFVLLAASYSKSTKIDSGEEVPDVAEPESLLLRNYFDFR